MATQITSLHSEDISNLLHRLSSKSVMERKSAIKQLKRTLFGASGYLAALSLVYVSEHDPSFTVRNIARQALYVRQVPMDQNIAWDKVYSFWND